MSVHDNVQPNYAQHDFLRSFAPVRKAYNTKLVVYYQHVMILYGILHGMIMWHDYVHPDNPKPQVAMPCFIVRVPKSKIFCGTALKIV